MSDAEDTEAVPTKPGITAATVPIDEVAPSENISINVPQIEIANPSTKQIKSSSNGPSKNEAVGIPEDSKKNGNRSKESKKQANKIEAKKLQPCPPPQSRCKVRSRDMRQCKKHFREMIGKHEIRNDELEQRETDLRQRMEMLECSMPAVMVWNIWRQAQGAPVSHLREIVEKQFLGPAAGFATCPSTPSQHWDCRVREVEAERKQALHRAEEARQVFAVKGDALKFQKQQIEEARRLQEERKIQIAKLEEEVKRLQDALKKAQGDENLCETGECGEIKCREMWLQDVSSVSSIHSTDLECLTRLQDLAEAELCMKRQIADLERRECAYMRTLQQADEMWSKMEDENASSLGNLKEQLEAKISANQQLADRIVELEDDIEKLRTQLTKALATLDEYKSKTFADIGFGDVNISTEEKIEQTDEQVQEIKVSEECKAEDVIVTKETRFSKDGVAKTEEIEKPRKYGDTPIEKRDESELKEQTTVEKTSISDLGVTDGQLNHEPIRITSKISTTEGELVQAHPGSEDAETQSIVTEPGLEKETATDERTQVEATTTTETVAEIGREVLTERLPEQEQQKTTMLGEVVEVNGKHLDVPVAGVNSSNPSENRASLVHLLKTPMEDNDAEISVATRIEDNSTDQKDAFQLAPEAPAQPIFRTVTNPVYEKASESTLKINSRITDEIVSETSSEPAPTPIVQAADKAAPQVIGETIGVTTGSSINASSEPVINADPITSPEVTKEAVPQIVSEIKPIVSPVSSIAGTPEPVLEPVTKPAIDAVLIPPPEPVIEIVERPVLEPILEVIEPVQENLAENTLIVPIQTLLSWHEITACLRKQILTCPQCSSTSRDIGQMLEEIRTYLGKDAPELAEIECAKVKEVQNPVPLSTKKGPCICKPRSCPLDGPHTVEPAQANVQIQTVVDGHSQTSMLIKIPNRESRSSKSKGLPKSREEVKLMSIDEGTEPDPGMRRAKSIPEARDESTVTVGDIASQTEPIRKTPSISKEEEKPCVCPTGVCPKKKTRPQSHDECTLGKIVTSTKKTLGKEYKSTADAILAPAIKVRPSNEPASSPMTGVAKADDAFSESSSFACCMCGKPATPATSRKTTSIPIPTKSVFKSKVMMASEGSEDDFLCCSCKAKGSSNDRPKYSLLSKSSEKSSDIGGLSKRVKPASKVIKTSCSREICCPCENQEMHVFTKTLTTELEVTKSKTRPETKDVCCLAKISRDKVLKTESRRRKDKDSIKTATPSVSNSGSGQLSSSSSTHKGSRTNDSSESNVCCSSIEQVMDMTKKKGKGKKCACDGQEGKNKNEECVCGEDNEPMLSKEKNHVESSESCSCPPKLFDKC